MESSVIKVLDDLDVQILDILQKESQVSQSLRRVNLSPAARIKRLDGEGFIDKQVAILNQEKLGFDLLCFIL